MREYKPGNSYRYLFLFMFVLYWLLGAMYIFTPIYYFIKHRITLEDNLSFSLYPVLYFFICFMLLLYQYYKLYRIKVEIDSKQIIYTNRRSFRIINYKDIRKLKLNLFGNNSSIKLFTQTQKIKIHLVFEDAYEFLLEVKEGLDTSGKSELYSHKKLYKFVRMILNAEIMQEWGIRLTFIVIFELLLLLAIFSIITITDTKIIIAISGYISIMISSFIPVFIIQNRYKKESDENSFFFPPRDMEYEKRIIRKGYFMSGLFFTIMIVLILII